MHNEFHLIALAADSATLARPRSISPMVRRGEPDGLCMYLASPAGSVRADFAGDGGFRIRAGTDFVGECRRFVGTELPIMCTR